MFYVLSDCLVAQIVHEICLPIPLQPRGIKAVEHTLQHGIRHWREKLEGRVPELAHRIENFVCLFQRSRRTPNDAAHFLEMQSLRERWSRRNGEKCKESIDLIRRFDNELAIPLHHIGSLDEVPQHRARA